MDIVTLKKSVAVFLSELNTFDLSSGTPVLTTNHIRGYAQAPFSLPETDLPVACIFTRTATYPVPPPQSYDRFYPETRDFDFAFFIAIAQSGLDGEAEARVEPYIDYCRDWISSHIQLYDEKTQNPIPGIQRSYIVKDTGVFIRKFNPDSVLYSGVSYTVRVEGKNVITYANQ